jgi:uncharacterized OB-fold protein
MSYKETYEFEAQGWFITMWKNHGNNPETYGFVACRGYGLGVKWLEGDVEVGKRVDTVWAILAKIQPKKKLVIDK